MKPVPPNAAMRAPPASAWHNRQGLAADLRHLGVAAGDALMVHAALRSVGKVVAGADAVIAALRDAVGPTGTLLAYADWEADLWAADHGRMEQNPLVIPVRDEFRAHALPFDPAASRATRDNGAFPELLRTTPGARRSANPGASCVALGHRAAFFVADHAMDYGYGPDSPFGELVAAEGKVLMLGAPLDRMTLQHHAEHKARLPNKRVVRIEQPVRAADGSTHWRWFEEFNTSVPVIAGLADDYFAGIVQDFLATGEGARGKVGDADCVLVPAAPMVRFAIAWLEGRFG